MREILSSVSFGTDLRMQEDNDILNGAQLSEKCIFKNKRGGKLAVVPLIVDLRRLLHCKSSMEVVPGVSAIFICQDRVIHDMVHSHRL